MNKRGKTILATLGAVTALGVGGVAITQAGATQSKPAATSTASQGASQKTAAGARSESANQPDTDTVQSGDQTTPDGPQGSQSSETPGESSTSEVPGNDGPGGHADEPGNASAAHQFDGQE